jgi:hypothetical protein
VKRKWMTSFVTMAEVAPPNLTPGANPTPLLTQTLHWLSCIGAFIKETQEKATEPIFTHYKLLNHFHFERHVGLKSHYSLGSAFFQPMKNEGHSSLH